MLEEIEKKHSRKNENIESKMNQVDAANQARR